ASGDLILGLFDGTDGGSYSAASARAAGGCAPMLLCMWEIWIPPSRKDKLFDIFNQIAPVVSIRVCRDQISRLSLGYAYVNYSHAQDASRALELLNYTGVNGKPMRIMFSHRDPSIRKSSSANIFIKNLDKAIDNRALYDTFSAFGNILSCKVATDNTGQSKGYGFVQFEQEEAAQSAIDKLNGMLLNDKQVYVGQFVRRQERERSMVTLAQSLVQLSCGMQMGNLKALDLVNFENADDAANAVDNLNGKTVSDDREWYVGRAQKKAEREAELKAKFEQERKAKMEKFQGANLYLKNLDDSIDDEKLRDLFSEYGTITSCKVMRDPQGQSRGSGFVAFSSPEEATRAVSEMNGKMAGRKPLYVALAQRKRREKGEIAGFGYQQQLLPGIRPGMAQMQNFMLPFQLQRQSQQGQRMGGRRGGAQQLQQQQQQQLLQRNANHGLRYMHNTRNGPDPSLMPPSLMGGMMPMPLDVSGIPVGNAETTRPQPVPITALASALASASPDQQRAMLGEQLFPLVDQLEHDHAGKVTGMLLEMDQTEVLHLIESPDALKAKVQEAMDVLRLAQATAVANQSDQLASL
ncbi:hypothetical protein KI387_004018, partial [Taxus chinensis]